ncbi:thiol-disulfide oxidoreductase ResA [Bacillus testis]|uniref:thiol-disulfide oxidoreductase ResA n=1 Tax=Bacillus testis TaxID=1622072 RepID=UPI00067EF7DB|nr:thiol-disulfide oxidoreductase ResA [Bacillus testis]
MDKKKQRLAIRTAILVVLLIALAYTLYANFTKDKNDEVSKGDQAPNFVLKDLNGKSHKLSDYKGKGVFINFWATWCKPCEEEMPAINDMYRQYKKQGVEVLAVNVAESDVVIGDYRDRLGLDFPILKDSDEAVEEVYGVYNLPASFLIDQDGKVVYAKTGAIEPDELKQLFEQVKP